MFPLVHIHVALMSSKTKMMRMRSLSGEVLHELPQILRNLLSFPAQNHALVDMTPEGIHSLLLLLTAMTRFLARMVEDELIYTASVFALLASTCPQTILPCHSFQRLLAGSPWLQMGHLLDDIRNALQSLYVKVMCDGVELRRVNFLWRIHISLDRLISYFFGLFFEACSQLILSDAYFQCGVDRAAFLITMLTEYALGIINAILAFTASGKQVATQQHLLLGGRLDSEVLIGPHLRQ